MNNETQGAVVINLGDATQNNSNNSSNTNSNSNDNKKKQDTLFGPNIGIVTGGPEWTDNAEETKDELTADVVKGWIAKSKEAAHSTTTLQALVNLKRPSLRLSPLEIATSDDPNHVDSQHHHGLEFEYDCDAAKCGIKVHVVLSPTHHLSDTSSLSKNTKLPVFETVTEGGFGNKLKLEEGAMLELGRFEHRLDNAAQSSIPVPGSSAEKADDQHVEKQISETSTPEVASADIAASRPAKNSRFTGFHLRKRAVDRSVAGPALAVVDAETAETSEDKAKEAKDDEAEAGVKVIITLTALDANEKPLRVKNEQTTYLHIVRFGRPAMAIEGEIHEEDNRPWVVKVVKREATIGMHTFHLHEIYGLSSNSNTTAPNTAPLPTSYPPTSPLTPAQSAPAEEEPSSECLVCLSSPREVVLLPCRHLVACRECAVNMIEYGAGGQITHSEAPEVAPPRVPPSPVGGQEGAAEEDITTGRNADGLDENGPAPRGSEADAPQPAPIAPAPTFPNPTRRKRRAKGWACPVCRQPYTSLLRITTTAPSKDDHERDSSDTDLLPHVNNTYSTTAAAGTPPTSPRFAFLRNWTGRAPPPQDAAAANV
ncbi:hypothetical protein EUX98_g4426 [Antrodiella citrinella]|uniref:RING-type domain-containing protein n=1 Tax=Antrodiella citrinella TaxID=2447956 RepID=A0A4V3XIM3_9APHY|nr:hypothetical protein EUX98_g4426 [Antrodiella citrinella]